MAPTTPQVVDVHTHMYPPEYVKMLEARDSIPLVRSIPSSPDPRLVLLEAEVPLLEQAEREAAHGGDTRVTTVPGRPLTKHYASLAQKMHFMDTHKIDISVVSLANPWLDFLDARESGSVAHDLKVAFSAMCATHPGRLYFFATLPVTALVPVILSSVASAATLPYCRGVILGTAGLGTGRGLDDPALLPILGALAAADLDAVPGLRLLLAHAGGALPFLAGRIESCVAHDAHLAGGRGARPQKSPWEVLRTQVYLDAVVYSDVGQMAAVHASSGGFDVVASSERLMFGTEHSFFPPSERDEVGEWESAPSNVEAITKALGEGTREADNVMGVSAVRVLRLYPVRDGECKASGP